MTAPIAVQLYTVRDLLAQDFAGVVKRIADIGYIGVETFPFPNMTPQAAGRMFRDLGLVVPSAHTPLPLGDKKNEVLDTAAALSCKCIVCAALGPDHYTTVDEIRRSCDLFNQSHAVAAESGLTFAIHNHWWEFEPIEPGRSVFQVMLEHLEPGMLFEVDTYWAQTGGADPVEVVRQLGKRAPLLHIKDGPAVQDAPMVAVGEGSLDIPAIVQAGGDATEWLIVELDWCATDMLEAVKKSYFYLVGRGLARGHAR